MAIIVSPNTSPHPENGWFDVRIIAPLTPGDQLEEQVRPMPVDRDVTDLVDDQQFGLAVQLESFFKSILDVGPGQRGDQRLPPVRLPLLALQDASYRPASFLSSLCALAIVS